MNLTAFDSLAGSHYKALGGIELFWHISHRADIRALPLADRHYNRQKVGTPQFVPPGRCLVLLTEQADALWVSSWPIAEYTHHAWAGAWVCTLFRNEGAVLSSLLIRQAVAATRWAWPDVPLLGMVTFVDTHFIKSTNPGACYKWAGFRVVGQTKVNKLIALQLLPACMPAAAPPVGAQLSLMEAV